MAGKRYECRSRASRAQRDRRGIELYLPQELITWAEEEALRRTKGGRPTNRSEVIVDCIRHYSGLSQQ